MSRETIEVLVLNLLALIQNVLVRALRRHVVVGRPRHVFDIAVVVLVHV